MNANDIEIPGPDFDKARRAWHELHQAEAQLIRLEGYSRMSHAMKSDRMKWQQQASRARQTLNAYFK
jgi:hypothetical protein